MLFYDLTEKSSFLNAVEWLKDTQKLQLLFIQIYNNTHEHTVVMLIGNKLDLVIENPKLRCVSPKEVQGFCQ